ncbi:hypothetical protein EVAR_96654_1 [Eumeta japonica]|uniref:Uncharacterized protein n=1 Tax=Eumeta variegata TaxID=151549 RepID=A0A4C2A672_EUMVA|nr:hypothetical protein EVAR_96654_1 [Eumeta japonica]
MVRALPEKQPQQFYKGGCYSDWLGRSKLQLLGDREQQILFASRASPPARPRAGYHILPFMNVPAMRHEIARCAPCANQGAGGGGRRAVRITHRAATGLIFICEKTTSGPGDARIDRFGYRTADGYGDSPVLLNYSRKKVPHIRPTASGTSL